MASPLDILTLFENSHTVLTNDVDVALSPADCHNYKVTVSNSCTDDSGVGLSFDTFYMTAQFRSPAPEKTVEEERKRDGTTKIISMRLSYLVTAELIVDDFFFLLLDQTAANDTIIITPINPDGAEYEIDQASWQVENSSDGNADTYPATITFRVKDTDRFVVPCCPDDSIVSFEDPCDDGEGGGGEPPADPCEDYVVSITFSDPTLSPDITGGPGAATTTYRWLYDDGSGVFTQISTAGSINVTNPGIYRLIATRGTCQASYDYEYFGECDDFEVLLTEPVDGVLVASANRIATFEWQKDTGGGYATIGGETGSILIATEDADYKVIATYGDCEDEAELTVTLDVCAHSVEITRDENTLTAVVTDNSGTPTYQWYGDIGDGNGMVLLSGATGSTYFATVPGCYQVKVTADGCDKYATFLILDVCVGFDVLIESVTPDGGSGVDITATAINPPDSVTYVWYQITNGVFQQIGTGISVNTELTGTVKVVATSGACVAEDMTSFCVDPGVLENYESQFGDNTNYEYEITIFTLPDPGTYSVNEINSMMLSFRNGVKLEYTDDLSAIAAAKRRTYFEIDFALNKIVLDSGFPLKTTEKLEAMLINTP